MSSQNAAAGMQGDSNPVPFIHHAHNQPTLCKCNNWTCGRLFPRVLVMENFKVKKFMIFFSVLFTKLIITKFDSAMGKFVLANKTKNITTQKVILLIPEFQVCTKQRLTVSNIPIQKRYKKSHWELDPKKSSKIFFTLHKFYILLRSPEFGSMAGEKECNMNLEIFTEKRFAQGMAHLPCFLPNNCFLLSYYTFTTSLSTKQSWACDNNTRTM